MSEDRQWLPPDRAPDIWRYIDGEWGIHPVVEVLDETLNREWKACDGESLEVKIWITRKED